MEIRKTKYVTLEKAIANGSAASTYTAELALDDNYDMCVGVCVTDLGAGLASNFKINLQNKDGAILTDIPADACVVAKEDGSAPNERFLETAFAVKGARVVTLSVITSAVASADTTVQVTFKLVQLKKPVSI